GARYLCPHSITAVHAVPVGVGNSERVTRTARSAPDTIVLQASADAIRLGRAVDGDGVELADGNLGVLPGFTSVERGVHAAIVAEYHVRAVGGVDPECVVVDVNVVQRIVCE